VLPGRRRVKGGKRLTAHKRLARVEELEVREGETVKGGLKNSQKEAGLRGKTKPVSGSRMLPLRLKVL